MLGGIAPNGVAGSRSEIARSSTLLPMPLRPRMPYLCPYASVSVAFFRSVFPGTASEMSSSVMSRRLFFDAFPLAA